MEDMYDGRWKLTIDNVQQDDAGQITLVAENAHGTDSSTAKFTVKRVFDSF